MIRSLLASIDGLHAVKNFSKNQAHAVTSLPHRELRHQWDTHLGVGIWDLGVHILGWGDLNSYMNLSKDFLYFKGKSMCGTMDLGSL